jgi:16S rRNA (guanine527-N7)-methyltransferase
MLKQGLEELGFSAELIERVLPKLNSYINELELFNSAYDLVGADTHQDIVVRHILDSLAPYSHLQNLISQAKQNSTEQIEIADVGTGGGLPGIPLAIVFDDVHFTLVERMTKRCSFLENCRAVLQLENVTVKTLEAERVPQNSFDIVVFRAFRPLEKKMIRVLLRILKPNGKLAAYKAKMEKIQAEMEGIAQWAPNWDVLPLRVPFLPENERNLVVIPKP